MSAQKYATLLHHHNDNDDDDDNGRTTRISEHKVVLQKIVHKDILSDSCCDICACDCYTQRSTDAAPVTFDCAECDAYDCNNNNYLKCNDESRVSSACSCCNAEKVLKTKRKKYKQRSLTLPRPKTGSTTTTNRTTTTRCSKRSSSAGSSLRHIKPNKCNNMARQSRRSKYMRDCEILHDLTYVFNNSTSLPSLQQQQQHNLFENTKQSQALLSNLQCKSIWPAPRHNKLMPLKLCASMSTLCLQPAVRQAFEQVPEHDQKIINRMAAKRSEQSAAKENAWLARRFWENERYERELMKCEQMEEYKQAVRDKQFKDYLLTKARLQELAQRDWEQLEQLRASLQQKDSRTRKRLETLSIERELRRQQRRCEDLRKFEAVCLQQEEQQMGENLRRQNSCERLQNRLKRAQNTRHEILDAHLRRLRYDNEVAQLLHEEHWRENLKLEAAKQHQLKDQICRKRWRTQQFAKNREKRNEALAKTAKLSASLRELVRSTLGTDATDIIK